MHLFDNRYPFAQGVALVHSDASASDYLLLRKRLGLDRCVLVQPSSYGRDHRVLINGLHALGNSARGIAVVDPYVSEHELAELNSHGVVGVRFNLVQRGAINETMLAAVSKRIRSMGWHIQVHLLPEDFIRLADLLISLDVSIVLDHFARIQTISELALSVERNVHKLLATGLGWIKISGTYIASTDAPYYKNLDGFVERILIKHPDRIVWGTDWPHVTEAIKPDDAELVNLLPRWIPTNDLRQLVLVENPSKLYGFDKPH